MKEKILNSLVQVIIGGILFLLIACSPLKIQHYYHAHAIACVCCSHESSNCFSSTKIIFVLDDGVLLEALEPTGFQCSVYNNSTYWDIDVDSNQNIVKKKMVNYSAPPMSSEIKELPIPSPKK